MSKLKRMLESGEDFTEDSEAELHTGVYYWVWLPRRRLLLGCKNNEQEAEEWGYRATSKSEEKYEVVPLRTKDSARASQLIKGRELSRTRDLDESTKRHKHKL